MRTNKRLDPLYELSIEFEKLRNDIQRNADSITEMQQRIDELDNGDQRKVKLRMTSVVEFEIDGVHKHQRIDRPYFNFDEDTGCVQIVGADFLENLDGTKTYRITIEQLD